MVVPYWYQDEAIEAGIEFFQSKKKENGIIIAPTGSGKSVIIANLCKRLNSKTLVFQPSKEILAQNYEKYTAYGYRAGIYSASAGMKYIDDTTFVTIGSVINKPHLFKDFKYFIVDECHYVNAEEGMYKEFFTKFAGVKVLGLTATPYRLGSNGFEGSMLRFITRTSPRVFNKVLYYIQNKTCFEAGFVAPLEYFKFSVVDRTQLKMNSTGSDFTEQSIRAYFKEIDMPSKIIEYGNRILKKRKNLLIYCSITSEAIRVAASIPGAVVLTSDTDPEERKSIEKKFKRGEIRCVVLVGIWVVGFDYPGLEAVLIGKSTMSLAWYYQVIGRVMRKHTYPDGSKKIGWVIDLGGNIDMFGRVETLHIDHDAKGLFIIKNNGRQLTNVTFSKT